ncbi:MAG: SprT-like domain-containing protein [Burkholderiales bacterium]|nr:SprT-like domain-containing protein [Burkholderiales bacterium]
MDPTDDVYRELQTAFDHFNRELFSDAPLPSCLITLQREKRTYGYFSPDRFVRRHDGRKAHEIALNPAYFGVVPIVEILQTIVHEMAHLWQHEHGKPGRRRYHNVEWANRMEAMGLMPSDTGKPGGKRTGEHMADYPIEGGRFLAATDALLTKDFRVSWLDRFPARDHTPTPGLASALGDGEIDDEFAHDATVTIDLSLFAPLEPPKSNRVKYSCHACELNVWGKPGLRVICGECGSNFQPA